MNVQASGAAAAPQVTYVDAAKVTELFAKPGALANGPDFTASIARRTAAGQVEIHAKETDIFYIVDGSATFVTGGTMVGGKETRPNQMLGTDITGGQTHQLKKGDFISHSGRRPALVQGSAVERRHLLHGEGGEAVGPQEWPRASGRSMDGSRIRIDEFACGLLSSSQTGIVARPQAPQEPAFEVASVKRNTSGDQRRIYRFRRWHR